MHCQVDNLYGVSLSLGRGQRRIIAFLSNYHQSELVLGVSINLEFKGSSDVRENFGCVNFSGDERIAEEKANYLFLSFFSPPPHLPTFLA